MVKIFKIKIWTFLKRFYVFVIIALFVIFLLSQGVIYDKDTLKYGVTYSKKQAISLGLDPEELYQAMLDDLGVKRIRLSAYWNEVEVEDDLYFWDDLDWQIDEANKQGAEVILAVGARLPRWPECHIPTWVGELDETERQQATLEYIAKVIERYKEKENIINWQVENEPFLSMFGECPDLDKEFLDREVALVKKLDSREVIITDAGELSSWIPAAKRADVFGTTMYRDTYSEVLDRYIHYPMEPGFFRLKKNIARLFANPSKWIVIELQAEPWGPKPFQELSQAERDRTMNLQKFKEIIDFSHQAGFNEFYLWGVEWWYWEKEVKKNDAIWREAKLLFND